MVAAPPNPWRLLALVVAARVALGVQFQAIGALGPLLVGEAGLAADYTALGALIGAYSLAGIAVALPAGWLMARFGDRAVLLAGLGLMAAGGLVLAAAPGFGVAMAGRMVAGAGSTLLTTACAKLVLDAFTGPRLVTAMGVLLSAWPFGIGLALLALPWFGEAWRMGLVASALLCAAALPPLWRAVPPRGDAAGEAASSSRLRPGEWAPLLAVGLLWASYNAAFAVALGFAPAFLTAGGYTAEAAGALASLIGWAILPLLPLGGAIAERLGRPGLISAGCLAGMAVAVLALAAGVGPPWLALTAFGLLSAPPASLIMAMLGRVLSPESRAFGLGVHYMQFYLAVAAVPPFAGWVRDATGAPSAPLLVAAASLAVALAAQAGLSALLARRG